MRKRKPWMCLLALPHDYGEQLKVAVAEVQAAAAQRLLHPGGDPI